MDYFTLFLGHLKEFAAGWLAGSSVVFHLKLK